MIIKVNNLHQYNGSFLRLLVNWHGYTKVTLSGVQIHLTLSRVQEGSSELGPGESIPCPLEPKPLI